MPTSPTKTSIIFNVSISLLYFALIVKIRDLLEAVKGSKSILQLPFSLEVTLLFCSANKMATITFGTVVPKTGTF